MIKFKKGVKLDGITKECIWAMSVVDRHFDLYFERDIVITSVNDGRHMKTSKHYEGNAFDLRTWTTDTSGVQMCADLKQGIGIALSDRLGIEYDLVVEKDHIHIEYDPS
ncbi:MAG: hypothetical protein OCD76_07290 [Reichenbachiella sp.]